MKYKIITLMCMLLVGFAFFASSYAAEPADVVFTGGKIYTMNEKQPWAEAIAVTNMALDNYQGVKTIW